MTEQEQAGRDKMGEPALPMWSLDAGPVLATLVTRARDPVHVRLVSFRKL